MQLGKLRCNHNLVQHLDALQMEAAEFRVQPSNQDKFSVDFTTDDIAEN